MSLSQTADVTSVVEKDAKNSKGRRPGLYALTGIRFFASYYVVLYHSHLPLFLEAHGLIFAANFIKNGNLAVVLFFILSGFILSYTYDGKIKNVKDMRLFWEARFARIWPLYFVSLLLSTLLNHTTPGPLQATATIFMVQAWSPTNHALGGAWNFVCWTLSTEALFYCLFPFIQVRTESRSLRGLGALIGLMIAIAIVFNTGQHSYHTATSGLFSYLPLAMVHVPEFVIGMCVGHIFLVRQAASQRWLKGFGAWLVRYEVFTWAGLVASVIFLCHQSTLMSSLTAASFPVLLFGLASEKSILQRFLSSRLILIGGQISYGVYLLQWPCKTFINMVCDHLQMGSLITRSILDIGTLTLVSALTFYLIENPAREMIRGLFLAPAMQETIDKEILRSSHDAS